MKYPQLNELPVTRDTVELFGGYNHNLRISSGEFYDMMNLTSTYYPVLSPRSKRGVYKSSGSPQGIISKDKLCYVDGDAFYVDGKAVPDFSLSTAAKDCPKTLVSMGAYVIIMPDRKWINSEDITEHGDIDAKYTSTANVKLTLCRLDGSDYTLQFTQDHEPREGVVNMALWLDTSTVPHTLKQYSSSSRSWTQIATTYVRIEAAGIGASFAQYDGVEISGLKGSDLKDANGNPITGTTADELAELNDSTVIWERQDDYIVIVGIISKEITLSSEISVTRKIPEMDFMIESGNRLWGCRYGIANNGEFVNEIYASKLGDFKNWQSFLGISTDSYTVGVGSDGAFTGAINHLGFPLFFKENCLHKIYGELPSNYQVQTTSCRGVQRGSAKSLAIVNEVLYYKARSAVCSYDGSLPTEISQALGEERYGEASAGVCGNKYYISMKDDRGVWHLFAYDTLKGMWHKEDNTQAHSFCSHRGELYFIDAADNSIKTVLGSGTPEAEEVSWMAETGIIGTATPDKKYVSKVLLRMYLELRSALDIYIEYDSTGAWEYVTKATGISLKTFNVPIKPRRCDHFRLRIVGKGVAKIFSVTKYTEQGSDF